MDKWDLIFIKDVLIKRVIEEIKEFIDNRDQWMKKYYLAKKNWMYMQKYPLQVKRNHEYRKKHNSFNSVVEKAGYLKKGMNNE